jgi:glucosyl-dolichyl phosphate glucuronosyltransferase
MHQYPQVSIIIPTLNRSAVLSQTLQSIILLNTPKEKFEILIIDNGSTDNTKYISTEFIKNYPDYAITYFYEPVPGLLAARHKGYFESAGEILVFIDDDIKPHPDWLSSILEAFNDKNTMLVGGKNLPQYSIPAPEWINSLWVENEYGRYCGQLSLLDFGDMQKEIDPLFIWGLNFSIRKEALRLLGGFNPDTMPKLLQRFQGDGETGLSIKAKMAGMKAIYHPGALVHHMIPPERLNLEFFIKRQYFQGVCTSFSLLRKQLSSHQPRINVTSDYYKFLVKTFILQFKRVFIFNKERRLKNLFKTHYLKGIIFHHKALLQHPELADWITRKDYLDYSLPVDWNSTNTNKDLSRSY